MTLTQLKYILAVDKHRHFGAAAKECHVTQPTLSMQIQKLEENLDVQIFDRGQTPIETTPAGKEIIVRAKDILHKADELENFVKVEKGELVGEFRLGIIPTVAPYLLPLFIDRFQKSCPGITLIIKELTTEEIITELKDYRLDGGILATPLHEQTLYEDVLYYEPFWVYTNKNHHLALKKDVSSRDLNVKDALLLTSGHCFRDQALELCSSSKNKDEKLSLECGSFETLVNLVDELPKFTLLPDLLVRGFSKSKKERLRSFSVKNTPTREISLVYNVSIAKRAIAKELKNCIKSSLPENILNLTSKKILPVHL